jgi:nicotinate-nucleotide adenylyltransferase
MKTRASITRRASTPRTVRRLGIFGGSFDPPHVGHLIVAESAVEQLRLDKVVFVPAYYPPHKLGNQQSSATDRLAMVRLIIKGNPRFAVSDLEVRRKGISYTVDTLRSFKSRFENAELFFIIGGDSLSQFSTWKDPEEILNLAHLVVYPRPLQNLADVPMSLPRAEVLQGPMIEISSSDIRLKVSHDESIRYLVPDEVVRYVKVHKLYTHS